MCRENSSRKLLFFLEDQSARTANSTPTKSTNGADESCQKNGKSIDDLIDSLNDTTETIKSNSRKKYKKPNERKFFFLNSFYPIDLLPQNIHRKSLRQQKNWRISWNH